VKEGGRGREEKEKERRRGISCGLHFFTGTVAQDFKSELFASNHPLGPTGLKKKDSFE
jgi:hypothetical protein